jgi:hypothetical protein
LFFNSERKTHQHMFLITCYWFKWLSNLSDRPKVEGYWW